jgi:hypothetical protein
MFIPTFDCHWQVVRDRSFQLRYRSLIRYRSFRNRSTIHGLLKAQAWAHRLNDIEVHGLGPRAGPGLELDSLNSGLKFQVELPYRGGKTVTRMPAAFQVLTSISSMYTSSMDTFLRDSAYSGSG